MNPKIQMIKMIKMGIMKIMEVNKTKKNKISRLNQIIAHNYPKLKKMNTLVLFNV